MNTPTRAEQAARARQASQPGAPEYLLAQKIGALLGETERVPLKTIARLISMVGEDQTWRLVAEAARVEEAGGMMTRDGSRRRTPGGVFFALARKALGRPQR